MSELRAVPLIVIDPNPFRDIDNYPLNELKVEELVESINMNGELWEGIIARPVAGNRVQIAFGHHRLEAARRAGHVTATVILRELTDLEMLRLMAHENGENKATHFLQHLNTWESARRFWRGSGDNSLQNDRIRASNTVSTRGRWVESERTQIAKMLGWMRRARRDDETSPLVPTPLAHACDRALKYVEAGVDRNQYANCMSVFAAEGVSSAEERRRTTSPSEARQREQERAAARHEPAPSRETEYPPHPTPRPTLIPETIRYETSGYYEEVLATSAEEELEEENLPAVLPPMPSQNNDQFLEEVLSAIRRVRGAMDGPTFGVSLLTITGSTGQFPRSLDEVEALLRLRTALEDFRRHVDGHIRAIDQMERRYGPTITVTQ